MQLKTVTYEHLHNNVYQENMAFYVKLIFNFEQ